MEEKHIFTTSRWKRFQDKLKLLKEEILKYTEPFKTKKPKPQVAEYTNPPKPAQPPESPKPEKVQIKPSKLVAKEHAEKLLTYLLLFAVVVIIVVGIVLSHQGSETSQVPTTKNGVYDLTPNNDLTNWKTYTYNDKSFSISYPAEWEVTKNPQNDPLAGSDSIRIKGYEGVVYLTPNVGPGGACPPGYKEVMLGNKKESVCNYINDNGVEAWEQIYIEFPENTLEIRAYANKPNEQNRKIVTIILSTLRFNSGL